MKQLAMLSLLSVFFACTPTYTSGETKCSVDGKCPPGFDCGGDSICYKHYTCSSSSTDSTCTTCLKGKCCNAASTCADNPACNTLLTCIGKCTESTCMSNCESAYPSGVTPLVNYLNCVDSYCTSSCSSSGTGG
jgi:hypothetical protein